MKTSTVQNVDDYIAEFPEETQIYLSQMRECIKNAAPEAEESISYMMPAYKLHGPLVYFGGFAKHIGFFATPNGNMAFKEELRPYKTGKGSIQFPLNKPLPLDLVKKIVDFRVAENIEKKKRKTK